MSNYEKLYKRYLYKKNELSFTKEQVIEKILKKFKAEEFSKTEILDLVNDDQLEYGKIFKCLKIENPQLLSNIFSSEEKNITKMN
ncbi:hypothetical protein JCM21714_4580 [Gracilibacillus boraciitolerans JCM 21714]|uniref:Uncharacterized protein n=1 Tax=Gracilibacillus boraciitolerans JCM 21714 TaxID=1298598 RepID=W4VQX1_9BACI|nr:hypothetical protein [Gracilibacillus boraciitolerans]GAE95354.1 hypothetical protein JCM21714_4580 [Gracilibacillus boraciitolerans JCM 21714]